jgi:hypothetical protein
MAIQTAIPGVGHAVAQSLVQARPSGVVLQSRGRSIRRIFGASTKKEEPEQGLFFYLSTPQSDVTSLAGCP